MCLHCERRLIREDLRMLPLSCNLSDQLFTKLKHLDRTNWIIKNSHLPVLIAALGWISTGFGLDFLRQVSVYSNLYIHHR